MRLFRTLLVLMFAFGVGISVISAQDAPEVVATDLTAPRHVFYGADGTLYIAEAGAGGDETATGPTGQGEVSVGFSARVSAVSVEGEQSVFLDELFSTAGDFGAVEGVSAVFIDEESAWLVMGQGTSRDSAPEGAIFSALAQIDLASGEIVNVIDLLAFEEENNPDGTPDIASNPQDIAVGEDGTVYLVDASANTLLSWTAEDGLALVASWAVDETGATPAPVPTSVVIAEDGSLYVGFLSGFPFPAGGARIEHWVDGELADTIEGLTLVTDLEIGQDGNLYAVQFASGFGDTGYNAESGSVVMVGEDGTLTPVIEGLSFPYGIAQAEDGSWVVTTGAAFGAPGSGSVIRIPAGM